MNLTYPSYHPSSLHPSQDDKTLIEKAAAAVRERVDAQMKTVSTLIIPHFPLFCNGVFDCSRWKWLGKDEYSFPEAPD